MHKKVKFIAAALMAAALLIVGIVMSSAPNHAPAQTRLSAATAANSYANLDDCPTLAEGYHGGCVDQLQTELNNAGNAGLAVDGTFGAPTQQAVIGFQQKNGVTPADGIVGPQTKQALDRVSGEAPAGPATSAPTDPVPLPPVNLGACPVLAEGYHGGCVDELQSELNFDDNAGLPVDGTFGATTQQAVITFQQQNGVTPADGIVGPQTKQALTNGDSVQTPQPGAPLTPFQICQQQQPGSVSDGHGGCTSDGITAEGKSASDCLKEAITDKANELIAQGATPEAAESAAAKVAEKLSLVYDAGSVFKCELLDNPDS